MSFEFKKASCVVVGAFNVYVFQPSFFAQTEIVKSGTKVIVLGDLSQPGFRINFEEHPMNWVVRPDRILVETTDSAVDCGKDVAIVLKTLPWTPLSALGVNFEFATSADDFNGMSARKLFHDIQVKRSVSQRTVHVGIDDGPHVFNLSLLKTDEGAEFVVNVHTEIKKLVGSESKTRTQISELAEGIAQQFTEFCNKSIALGREVFGVEINYANRNN